MKGHCSSFGVGRRPRAIRVGGNPRDRAAEGGRIVGARTPINIVTETAGIGAH